MDPKMIGLLFEVQVKSFQKCAKLQMLNGCGQAEPLQHEIWGRIAQLPSFVASGFTVLSKGWLCVGVGARSPP